MDKSAGEYSVHCWRGDLVDKFPHPPQTFEDAVQYAFGLLKSPKWEKDMRVRIDGPNGKSWDMEEIKKLQAKKR